MNSRKWTFLGKSKKNQRTFSQQTIFHSHNNLVNFRVFFVFQGLILKIKNSENFNDV